MSCEPAAQASSYARGEHASVLLHETIGQMFDRISTRFAQREALIAAHQGIRWTYAEFREQVEAFARGLSALGIEPGDRIGVWSPNCAEWIVCQFATAKIGAILVCINPAYRCYELEYALNAVQCKAIVTAVAFKSSNYIDMLAQLAPELETSSPDNLKIARLPDLRHVIVLADTTKSGARTYAGVVKLGATVSSAHVEQIGHRLDPLDAINIQFTSGTTGAPKGATLSHKNLVNNGKLSGEAMRLTEHDRLCIPLPLYHCFGMVMGNIACLAHGSAVVLPNDAFDPEITLRVIAAERCTAMLGVPTMFIAQLNHPHFERYDISSLRTGVMGGAPCPIEVMKRVMTQMHMEQVLIAYGQTETSPMNHITAVDDPIQKRVETVGRVTAHTEIKIVDATGRVVSQGGSGEICVRGCVVMLKYWGDEERTRATIDSEGWLHSGDIGRLDADGYLQIVGRLKDLIIRGGENIYPREIEEFLYTHPDILDAQVFGIADAYLGEQVCAWIKLREGQSLCADEIKTFCSNRIAHFKIPKHIRFVDNYPMTVTGKIQKFVMREQMQALLSGEKPA
jgi:fatty-acyl-CoA synthase